MRNNQIIIIFAVLLIVGFSCGKPSKVVNGNILNSIDIKYDSLFGLFIERNHYPRQIVPPENLKYHKGYPLERRVFSPKVYGLTFDLRLSNQVSHSYIPVLHIYNDSVQSLIPVYTILSQEDDSDSAAQRVFIKAFNDLTMQLRLNKKEDVISLLNSMMSLFNMERISSSYEFKIYKYICEDFIANGSYQSSCKDDILLNLPIIEKGYQDEGVLVYGSNSIVALVLDLDKAYLTNVTPLNLSCQSFK